jgi:hypothetical protein
VKAPEVTTLAIALPEIDPMKPEAMTAALAGPPRCRPAMAYARSMKKRPAPVVSRKAPNSTKVNTTVAATPSGRPKIPSWPR